MYGIYPERKINGYKYFDTFKFNGENYYLNTIVQMKSTDRKARDAQLVQLVEAGINNDGTAFWTYAFWNYLSGVRYAHYTRGPDEMIEKIIEPFPYPPTVGEQLYYKDSEVNEVMVGWAIYIIAMIGLMIFKGFISGWIVGTFLFFRWRKEKLKKPLVHDFGFDNVHVKARELRERET